LNFSGNQSVSNDTGIHLSTGWIDNNSQKGIINNHATEASRGAKQAGGRLQKLLAGDTD
jgi:hypothetical protein